MMQIFLENVTLICIYVLFLKSKEWSQNLTEAYTDTEAVRVFDYSNHRLDFFFREF